MNPMWVPLLRQILAQAPKVIALLLIVPIVIETKKASKKEKEDEPKTEGKGD